jgi:hypothetical protein
MKNFEGTFFNHLKLNRQITRIGIKNKNSTTN